MFIIWLWAKETITGLFRNFKATMLCLFLTVISLLLLSVSELARENASYFANQMNQQVQINVDLKSSITNYKPVEQRIGSLSGIKNITYISKAKAYQQMESELGQQKYILQSLGVNPFPIRLVITLNNPQEIAQVAKEIEKMNVAQSVQYGQSMVKKLFSITKAIQNGGIIAALFSGIITLSIIFSAISSNISQREKEIKIKKHVGAGKLVIRVPFILEAVAITIGAGWIVYRGSLYGYHMFVQWTVHTVPYLQLVPIGEIKTRLFFLVLLISIMLGLIGSLFSTEKKLKKLN